MLIILVCKIYYWINKVPLFWLACSTGYWNTDVLIIKILLCWLACSMGYWKTNVLITKLLLFWLVGRRCCWKMSTLIHCGQIILILWPADCLIPLTIWLVDCLIYLTVWFVWFFWFQIISYQTISSTAIQVVYYSYLQTSSTPSNQLFYVQYLSIFRFIESQV